MRRYVLIILGVAVLVWGVLAIALSSPTLKLGSGSKAASVSPACLPQTRRSQRGAARHRRQRLARPGNGLGQPPHADQLPRRAGLARSRSVSVRGERSGAHAGSCATTRRATARASCRASRSPQGEQVSVERDGSRARRRVASPSASTRPTRRPPSPDFPNPTAAAGRLPELLHAARRAGADPDGDDARPRPRAPATSSRPTARARATTAR